MASTGTGNVASIPGGDTRVAMGSGALLPLLDEFFPPPPLRIIVQKPGMINGGEPLACFILICFLLKLNIYSLPEEQRRNYLKNLKVTKKQNILIFTCF